MSKNKRQKLEDSSSSEDEDSSKFADAVDPVLHAKLYGSNGKPLLPIYHYQTYNLDGVYSNFVRTCDHFHITSALSVKRYD